MSLMIAPPQNASRYAALVAGHVRPPVWLWALGREDGQHRFQGMIPFIDEIRRKVSAPLSRRGVVRAAIFGSVAQGEATARSDVDFLVEFEKGRTLVDLSGITRQLATPAL